MSMEHNHTTSQHELSSATFIKPTENAARANKVTAFELYGELAHLSLTPNVNRRRIYDDPVS